MKKRRICFKYPSKSNYLFYDYLKRFKSLIKVNYEKIDKREEINFFVLIYSLFFLHKYNFKMAKSYINAYIFLVKPKIIFTFTDNDLSFYQLKIDHKKTKFIAFQNGSRSISGDLFGLKILNKKLSCDEIFVHNKYIAKKYEKIIDSKIILGGSTLNNFNVKTSNKKKYDITFISQYENEKNHNFKNYLGKTIHWKKYYKTEKLVLEIIKRFADKNNLCLNICLRLRSNNMYEKIFFQNILKKNFLFSEPWEKNNQYKICDQSELVVFIDSTLGYENLGRGNKTVAFSFRGEFVKDQSFNFGWPKNLPLDGPCWTSFYNKKLIYKLLKKNYFLKKEKWNNINKKYIYDLMVFKKNKMLKNDLFN